MSLASGTPSIAIAGFQPPHDCAKRHPVTAGHIKFGCSDMRSALAAYAEDLRIPAREIEGKSLAAIEAVFAKHAQSSGNQTVVMPTPRSAFGSRQAGRK